MILPTPEFDPMYAHDGVPFREKMIQYIQREFSDFLGADAYLLKADGGLDILSRIAHTRRTEQSVARFFHRSSRAAA